MLGWLKKVLVKSDQTPSVLFMFRFCRYANEAGIPDPLRKNFCVELYAVRDNPLDGQRVGEKYFAMYEFNWPQGTEEIKRAGKKGTYKQHCQLFARKVCQIPELSSKELATSNFARKRTVNPHFFPYLLLQLGPSEKPCPLHSQFEGLLLKRDHPFWGHFEIGLRGHEHCKCWVQIVMQQQYDEYVKNGVPSIGNPVLGKDGVPTGHFEEKTVPAITSI